MLKNRIITAFAGLLALAGTACTPDVEQEPKLSLNGQTVGVPAGGGTFVMEYSVENPIDGVLAQAECDAEWIDGFDLSKAGEISFTVERNPLGEGREAIVAVTYSKPEIHREFTVKQSAGGTFTLDMITVDAAAGGGSYSVTYCVADGAVPDTDAIEVSADKAWVKEFDTSVAGKIGFTVESNPATEDRECTVGVRFTATEAPQSFTVVQRGGVSALPFVIEMGAITYKNATYNVTPADKDMTYVSRAVEVAAFERYSSDEEYFLMELDYFSFMASIYGIPREQYLRNRVLVHGDRTLQADALSPQTDYYIYSYGLTSQGERLTDIVKERVTTTEVDMIGMTFRFDYEYIKRQQKVNVFAAPHQEEFLEQPYYYGILRTEGIRPGDTTADIMQNFINQMISDAMTYGGLTLEEAMELITYKGISAQGFSVIPGQEYVIMAAAIDTENGLLISRVSEERFFIPLSEPSDNIITLEVGKEGFTTAEIKVHTSNDDTYVALAAPANHFAGMTDAEILADLTKPERNLSNSMLSGDYTIKYSDRTRATSYCLYAFGFDGGTEATTGLTKINFRTHELEESDIELSINSDKYFDFRALKAAYPDEFSKVTGSTTVVLSLQAQTVPATEGARYWYAIDTGDFTQATNVYAWAEDLLVRGCPYPAANFYTQAPLGTTHTIYGMAADAEGNYGGLFRRAIVFTAEGMSPIEEYVSPPRYAPYAAPQYAAPVADADGSRFDIKYTDRVATENSDIKQPIYLK